MLDIPELDELICQQLSRHDLTQCTRVLVDDYLQERQYQELQQERETELAPGVPSKLVLMERLYKHCPNFQTELATIEMPHGQMGMAELIREYVLPRTRCLQVPSGRDYISSFRLKWILSRSSTLEELVLNAQISGAVDEKEKAYDQEEPETWQLKRLALRNCRNFTNKNTFWPWLWRRCGQVEHLELDNIHEDVWEQLVETGISYMPNLNKINITSYTSDKKHTEAILSSSRRGWEEVRLHCHRLSFPITAYLMKHKFTLQRLVLDGYCGVTDSEKVQLLACCPHLYDFTNVHTWEHNSSMPFGFNAHSFIDLDPDTGSLKHWECETSLKVLKVIIKDIPRPDLIMNDIDEAYPGQGRAIQNQVYDRLARFTNLEMLSLRVKFMNDAAPNCLEMSLESGLDKLSGLKKLKVLDVSGMETKIGEPEAQWMTEQWPKLHTIHGSPRRDGEKVAWDWLKQHHPEIELKKPSIGYEF
ncbi:MAG: hypothetical protein J3Q66DRAFT_443227 [Benniella sp.]|nr:MAG: hypothetical protein J3Q66DRAFT_443227 [Benniella sp.]